MSVKYKHSDVYSLYFCTFTCFNWLPLIEATKSYDLVYNWFNILKQENTSTVAYAILPNHLHCILYFPEANFDLNKIISVAGYFSHIKKAIEEKRLSPDVQYIFYTTLPASGEASFNTTNILGLDGSDSIDITKAEIEGRKQVQQVVEILLNEIPGFENAYLLETAMQVGVRETRRVIGDYVITGDDIKNGAKFLDSIARGCYGIDIHGQKGEESQMDDLPEGEYYDIPLRALFVKDSDNLLAAGKVISSTRQGHGALRIMPTSAATGEACGAVAALSVKNKKNMRMLDYKEISDFLLGNITVK